MTRKIKCSYLSLFLLSDNSTLFLLRHFKDTHSLICQKICYNKSTFPQSQNNLSVKNKSFKKEFKLSISINFWALCLITIQSFYWKTLRKGWIRKLLTQSKIGRLYGDLISLVKFSIFSSKSIDSLSHKNNHMSLTI